MENNLLNMRDLKIGIQKGSKTLLAVNGINFSIDEGEILGLAGESGCGKSLTALSIAGLLPQTAKILGGEIMYKNMPLTSMNEENLLKVRGREISVIFQDYRQALNPLIKVGRQITETLALGGGDRRNNKRRAVEMLFRLGFNEPKKIYSSYPHQLSGGMCQRVMAAIAAIGRPCLLLADEPSSALDTESQNLILSMLMEINREYKTSVLVISHDLAIIRQFCSRFLVMYAGKIIEECTAQSLFSPHHPYTQALIGAIPGREKRGKYLEYIPGKVPSIEDRFAGCPFAPRCKKAKPLCKEAFPPAIVTRCGKVHCFFPENGAADE